MERVSLLAEPPIEGRFYLVPTVLFSWMDLVSAWPVFLPRHEDAEHLNFSAEHYHIDPRFVNAREWRRAERYSWERGALGAFQRSPLTQTRYGTWSRLALPAPVWRRKRCNLATVEYLHGDNCLIRKLRAHYAGQPSVKSHAGWLCPHKRFALGSVAPDADGVITCPMHGLRIDAATGLALAEPTP